MPRATRKRVEKVKYHLVGDTKSCEFYCGLDPMLDTITRYHHRSAALTELLAEDPKRVCTACLQRFIKDRLNV